MNIKFLIELFFHVLLPSLVNGSCPEETGRPNPDSVLINLEETRALTDLVATNSLLLHQVSLFNYKQSIQKYSIAFLFVVTFSECSDCLKLTVSL